VSQFGFGSLEGRCGCVRCLENPTFILREQRKIFVCQPSLPWQAFMPVFHTVQMSLKLNPKTMIWIQQSTPLYYLIATTHGLASSLVTECSPHPTAAAFPKLNHHVRFHVPVEHAVAPFHAALQHRPKKFNLKTMIQICHSMLGGSIKPHIIALRKCKDIG